ncbi:hypothetical protein [Paenibacillus sp. HJGM_3]|uniref:hypothetical protein n=1 Tax=Paenibacillus sp. HJGM_3 TaxID=3379816 RepID=UPI00385C4E72
MLEDIRRKGMVFASKRSGDYMLVRRQLEARARTLFVEKGGKPVLSYPHYLTLGPCEWLKSWYKRGEVLTIPWEAFDPAIVSFTYGDLFPTMRYRDDKPYREVVYRKDEIVELTSGTDGRTYGMPREPGGRSGTSKHRCGTNRRFDPLYPSNCMSQHENPVPT